MKYCPKCKTEKSVEEFAKHKARYDGKSSYCKKCNSNAYKLWANKNKQKVRDYYALLTSDEKYELYLRKTYGIDIKQYNEMVKSQDYRCAICGLYQTEKRLLVVDHCHDTGVIRGLLCHNCNVALGNFKDNVQSLENAIDYLKQKRLALL